MEPGLEHRSFRYESLHCLLLHHITLLFTFYCIVIIFFFNRRLKSITLSEIWKKQNTDLEI
jgi:hypothetical protein